METIEFFSVFQTNFRNLITWTSTIQQRPNSC